jgi:hypothetical protein
MARRTIHRLCDIIDAIDAIYSLLKEKTFERMVSDRIAKAAF